jgi:hypothetical protein
MLIAEAQCEVRTVYVGGFVGQLASALIWIASAAIATFVDPPIGFWALAHWCSGDLPADTSNAPHGGSESRALTTEPLG